MKKVLSFLNSLLVFCFVLMIIVLLNVYLVLNVVNKLISKDNIINMIKNVDIAEVIGDEAKEEIYETLGEAGIPTDYVDSMLENEQIKETVGGYVSETVDYFLGSKEFPEITEKEFSAMLHDTFDTVIKEVESNNLNVSEYISPEEQVKVHEKIDLYAPQIVEKLPDAEEFINSQLNSNETVNEMQSKYRELQKNAEIVQSLCQKRNLFLIAAIVLIILIGLLKFARLKFMGWYIYLGVLCSINFIFTAKSIDYLYNNFVSEELDKVKGITDSLIGLVEKTYMNAFVVALILTLLFITIKTGIVFYYKKKSERKEISAV